MPTMYAGTWANIDHIIRQANRVFVVLDDDYRVADIPQVFQRTQQSVVIPLVQTNGRLIKDVQNAYQPGTNLTGQANTLRFTARQSIGTAIQRKIIQAHVNQELQPLTDFLEDFVGNLPTASCQLEDAEVFTGIANRQIGHCRQRLLTHPYMPRLTTQASATAIRARLSAEEFRQFFAHARRFGLAVAPLQVRHDAFERVGALDDVATVVQVFKVDVLRATAIKDDLLLICRQLVEWHFKAEFIVRRQ